MLPRGKYSYSILKTYFMKYSTAIHTSLKHLADECKFNFISLQRFLTEGRKINF